MGFYRHDQWGVACLADDTRVLTWSSSSGVITVSEALLPTQTSTRGGNKELKCAITWLCCPWCEWYCLWHIWFKWSILHLKCKFKLHMLVKLAKLQMSLFDIYKPCDHGCEMSLMFKWSWLHYNGWSWNSNWIEFKIIPIKSNRKSYWSHFKFNSNIAESYIFG